MSNSDKIAKKIFKFLQVENLPINFLSSPYYEEIRDYFLNNEEIEPFSNTMKIFVFILLEFEKLDKLNADAKLCYFSNILKNYPNIFENSKYHQSDSNYIKNNIKEFYLKELYTINDF